MKLRDRVGPGFGARGQDGRWRPEVDRRLGEFRGGQAPLALDRQARLKLLAERMRPLLTEAQKRKLDELLRAGQPEGPRPRPETMRPEPRRPQGERPEIGRPEIMRPELRRPEGERPEVRKPDGDRPEARPQGQYSRGPDGTWRFERGQGERRPSGDQQTGRKVQELLDSYQKAVRNAGPEERAELTRKLVRDIRALSGD